MDMYCRWYKKKREKLKEERKEYERVGKRKIQCEYYNG